MTDGVVMGGPRLRPEGGEEVPMDEHVSHATEHADLKRGIGPVLLFFFVLGDIVGAGIYALVGEVGAVVGGAIWAAFLTAFVLAIFTATSYAELVTKYPRAGGSATYVNNAFNNSFVSFMVAFAVAAASLTSASVLSLAFSGDYLLQFITVPSVLAALVFVVVVGLINFYGISESVRLNLIFTCIEITGSIADRRDRGRALGTGAGEPARAFEFKEGASLIPAILAGTVLSFYALIGFDDSVNVAEEVRNPSRIYPRAIFGGLLAAGIIYLLVTFTASMVVPTAQLAESSGPLLEVVERSPIRATTHAVRGHRAHRGLERGAYQHDHGLPCHLRHGGSGRVACGVRQGPSGPAYALGRHPLLHPRSLYASRDDRPQH